jgi:transcriptional regulator with XRE-family HTH domain
MESKKYKPVGEIVRELRLAKKLPLRKVAAQLDMDTSLFSKIERGEKRATKGQISKLAEIFGIEKNELMIPYLSEIVTNEIAEEECANEVLRVAEEQVQYKIEKNKK